MIAKTTQAVPHYVAIIGYGYWGPILHKYFNESNLFIVSKIYFPSLTSKSKQFENSDHAHLFTTCLEEIWNNKSISSIVIATPIPTHYELAKTAISHGKNIFIEKPTTTSHGLTKDLFKLADDKNVQVFTNYTESYSQSIEYALQLIENDSIGTIQSIDISIKKFDDRESIEALETIGPHALSILYTLNHKRIPIFSSPLIDADKCTHISFSATDSKISGALHLSLNSCQRNKLVEIKGSRGNIHMDMTKGIVTTKWYNSPLNLTTETLSFDESNNLRHVLKVYDDIINLRTNSNNSLSLFVAQCLDKIKE